MNSITRHFKLPRHPPAIAWALLLLIGGSIFVVLLATGSAGVPLASAAVLQTAMATRTPFQPITPTPFQPFGYTPSPVPTFTALPSPTQLPPTPFPSTFIRSGIDFSDEAETIEIDLQAGESPLNSGLPVHINFRPGWPCAWINARACTSLHYNGQVVLATVHSGVAGDGQELRNVLEGTTWFNSAAYSIEKIQANLHALQNAVVRMRQGEVTVEGMHVVAAVRLPAEQVGVYYSLPVDQALDFAAQSSPPLAEVLASRAPLLVIETCGWRLPSEGYPPDTSDTSAAIYLIAISQ